MKKTQKFIIILIYTIYIINLTIYSKSIAVSNTTNATSVSKTVESAKLILANGQEIANASFSDSMEYMQLTESLDICFVVDITTSMKATDGTGVSRFEREKRALHGIIKKFKQIYKNNEDMCRIALIQFSPHYYLRAELLLELTPISEYKENGNDEINKAINKMEYDVNRSYRN